MKAILATPRHQLSIYTSVQQHYNTCSIHTQCIYKSLVLVLEYLSIYTYKFSTNLSDSLHQAIVMSYSVTVGRWLFALVAVISIFFFFLFIMRASNKTTRDT